MKIPKLMVNLRPAHQLFNSSNRNFNYSGKGAGTMFHFSRSIYRELTPDVRVEKMPSQRESNLQRVLEACESAMERLATDRRHFTKPARTLFNDIRVYFPLSKQVRVYKVIECNMELALEYMNSQPHDGIGFDGNPLRCRATTRKGKPCQRVPLPNSQYCPSHQHLEEPLMEEVSTA